MKYLHYPLYCRGGSGFSNLVLSAESGVVAAFLLDRVLVIEGNIAPPANIVQYREHGVTNRHQARITDLMELPVAWVDADDVDYDPGAAFVMGEGDLMNNVFVWPSDRDTQSEDFLHFARGRTQVVTESAESRTAPIVRLFPSSRDGHNAENLGQYSYFFYLDAPTRRVVRALLRGVKPRAPYAELAKRVAGELGQFNAVHIRRGDFKKTFGTTTLDRRPEEAIRVLDQSFGRDEKVVILTDERGDPFFDEITAHFRDSVFVDYHILEHHQKEFFELPLHDSIALAYLSQLIGAEAKDFVGTMTSTYTNLVQRFRGNRGKEERFKFLWNELPNPGEVLKTRGSHPPSDCVPLHPDGSLVEEHEGFYSWNRVSPLLNPAWQREWPESFLWMADNGDTVSSGLLAEFASRSAEPQPDPTAPRENELTEPNSGAALVEVTVHLVGGVSCRAELASDSEILRDLFQALAAGLPGVPPEAPRLLQLPTDGGEKAYSFSSVNLVAVETRPAVLIEEATPVAEVPAQPQPRPQPAKAPKPASSPELTPAAKPEPAARDRRGAPIVREILERTRPAVESPRDFEPLPFVQVTDFLTPDEQSQLLASVLRGESSFARADAETREVSSGFDPAFAERIANRLRLLLPQVLPSFDLLRAVQPADLQLFAHRDGDARNGKDVQAADTDWDEITCTYFFHKESKPLSGGELRLRKGESIHLVEPRNNAVMIFPTSALVEVQPLRCPTKAFEDSRFAVTVRIA